MSRPTVLALATLKPAAMQDRLSAEYDLRTTIEDAAGARLTLYLRADRAEEGETAFRFADDTAGGVSGFWWVDRGFGYAVLAQGLDRPALLGLAEAVHRQVLPAPTAPPGRPAQTL